MNTTCKALPDLPGRGNIQLNGFPVDNYWFEPWLVQLQSDTFPPYHTSTLKYNMFFAHQELNSPKTISRKSVKMCPVLSNNHLILGGKIIQSMKSKLQ